MVLLLLAIEFIHQTFFFVHLLNHSNRNYRKQFVFTQTLRKLLANHLGIWPYWHSTEWISSELLFQKKSVSCFSFKRLFPLSSIFFETSFSLSWIECARFRCLLCLFLQLFCLHSSLTRKKLLSPLKHRFLCFRNEKRTIAFGGIWASSLWNKRNYFRPFWYFELYHGKGIGNILGLLFNVIFTACWRWCWWLKRNVSCNWIINEMLYYNIFVLIRIHFTVVYFFFLSFV